MKALKKLFILLMLVISSIAVSATVAPTNVTCTALGTTSIKITWVSTSTNVIGYTIAYGTSTGFNTPKIYRWNGGSGTNFSVTLTGLLPNTVYYYAVKAEGNTDTNDSPFTSFFSCSTQSSGGGGSAPVITSINCLASSNSIQVNYTVSSATNVIGYTVRSSTDPGFANSVWSWAGNSLSYTLSGLTSNTAYYFQVKSEGPADSLDSQLSTSSTCTTTGTVTSGLPQFSHIVIVVGENTNASSVFGSVNAPYINALANTGAKFTSSFALTHPSQPNYLMLFSGSNQGVTGDGLPGYQFTTGNIARQLVDAGKSCISYSEDLPSVGFNGGSSGGYQRKHNPVANWMGTGTNQVSGSLNQPWSAFPSNFNNLPTVSFVFPNQCNDGHDVCPPYNNRTKQYDIWIQNNLDAYKNWCKANNSLLIVTYDEDDFTSTNKISTVFYGAYVATNTYTQSINHYSILRLIEDMYGLSRLGGATSASQINFCWSQTPAISPGLTGNNVFLEVPIKTVYYNLNGTLIRDTAHLPKNEILLKTLIYKDSLKTTKFIIN